MSSCLNAIASSSSMVIWFWPNAALLLYHFVSVDPNDQKKTACFDIDVEVDDPLKAQMTSFLSSTTNQQEIAALEMKVCVCKDVNDTLCKLFPTHY